MTITADDLADYVERAPREVRDSDKLFEEFWADRGVKIDEMVAFWGAYCITAVNAKPQDALEIPEVFWAGITLRAFLAGLTLGRRELRDLVAPIDSFMAHMVEMEMDGGAARSALDALSELLGKVNA